MTEPIVIVLQTFKRTDVALRTIAAARQYLHYPDLRWYVADDGSPQAHVDAVIEALGDAPIIGLHSERRGYGGNINAAIQAAHDVAALVLPLEDDWELIAPLDLYPYAALLMEREDIAMVRLGYLNPGIRGECVAHSGALYWKLDHEPAEHWQLAFTGHPSLRHRRYRQAYGDYPTGLGPGDTELAYAYQYRVGSGPAIVWPAAYPPNGLFSHIGTVKTETML
jgi:glycosyltransferase involved in cell wall biosynthesis